MKGKKRLAAAWGAGLQPFFVFTLNRNRSYFLPIALIRQTLVGRGRRVRCFRGAFFCVTSLSKTSFFRESAPNSLSGSEKCPYERKNKQTPQRSYRLMCNYMCATCRMRQRSLQAPATIRKQKPQGVRKMEGKRTARATKNHRRRKTRGRKAQI